MAKRKKSQEVITVSESEESDESDSKSKMANKNKRRKIQVIDVSESEESSGSDSEVVLADRLKSQVKKETKTKTGSTVPRNYNTKNKKLECWTMFVNFSQCQHKADSYDDTANIFSEKWNPYQASLQYVAVYLALLKDIAEFSEVELGTHIKVIGEYLPSLELETKDLKDLLDLKDEELVVPGKLKYCMDNTDNFQYKIKGLNTWNSFVKFCGEKHFGKINPFYADGKIVKGYISCQLVSKDVSHTQTGLQVAEDFYIHNISNFLNHLGKYLKITNCGEDLLDSEEIQDLLLAGNHLDGRVPSKSSLVSKLAPTYDYTQYNANQNENFWDLQLVKQILQDVSSSALHKWKAAWQLGVTEDMINNSLQVKKKDPDFNLTLELYLKKRYGNEEQFWEELSTVDVLNQVRERIVTVSNIAFMFGVSRAKILEKVGKIKSEDEIQDERKLAAEKKRKGNEEKRVKKPTQLEMQIKMAEDNVQNLSDYEIMRLENLRERQALLAMLNFAEDKKALRAVTQSNGKNMPQPRDYGRREKSNRIKRKMEEFDPQAGLVADAGKPRRSPKWVGRWLPKARKDRIENLSNNTEHVPLTKEDFNKASPVPQVDLDVKDVISSNNDYHKSLRFMNSISDEVENVADEELSTKNLFKGYSKIVDSKVSSSDIRSVDTFGDLVCYGDSSGGVGVFLDGRSTTLKIHNEPVSRTLFVGGTQGRGILSSAQDGTVRLTDLTKQEVVVKYSWIQSGEKEQIGWIEPWEGTNYLMNSNRNSVKRIDLRSKKVDTLFTLPSQEFSDLNYPSQAVFLDEASHDPCFGTNIGVHPVNTNLTSFCQQSHVKIFDMRNTSQPVKTINIDKIQPTGAPLHYTKGISGANWSPVTGKYFLACPVKLPSIKDDAKQHHKPFIFDSTNLRTPVQFWPAKKSLYENASFSHNFGATWCPWDEGVFFTTAIYRYNAAPRPGIPSYITVVAVDAATGAIVSEISEDLSNSTYLIECHKSRNWVVVGNARGPGDLVIYQTGE